MKQLNLPFKIDEQFENWEFDLGFMPQRIVGYDSFKYIGKEEKEYFGIAIEDAELIFNADFLTAVIISIKCTIPALLVFVNESNSNKSFSHIRFDKYCTRFKGGKIMYGTNYNPKKKQLIIVYGKQRFIQKYLNEILSKFV